MSDDEKIIYAGATDAQKSKLELLLERLEFEPSEEQRRNMRVVVMPEHHASIAMAAMEALPEIRQALHNQSALTVPSSMKVEVPSI